MGALGLCFAVACGGSGGGTDAGPLVDNTKWEPTEDDEGVFGPRPPDAQCILEPIDCDEYYPWPKDECVDFQATSSCVAAYVPECFQQLTVMAVYTRMPSNPAEPLCNWLTLEQPSLRQIRAGDTVEIRIRHTGLTAPRPGEARMVFVIGDEIARDYQVLIPSNYLIETTEWTAPKDYPAGTRLLFHVDNHGSNEYQLLEVNVLQPTENTNL